MCMTWSEYSNSDFSEYWSHPLSAKSDFWTGRLTARVICLDLILNWIQLHTVVIYAANSHRQTVHTHCASVHQAAKLIAALLRVAGVTAGLAESNGSLPPGLWLMSPAGWVPRTGISSGTLRSVIEYGLPLPYTYRDIAIYMYGLCCM